MEAKSIDWQKCIRTTLVKFESLKNSSKKVWRASKLVKKSIQEQNHHEVMLKH